ncbi:type II secretion system F family protein [Flexivirga sp.]|uniref:type II secretion system F family protein n=1 Tax=Flexivirga sp. TaxID=1962927 RepID=UPI003F81354D
MNSPALLLLATLTVAAVFVAGVRDIAGVLSERARLHDLILADDDAPRSHGLSSLDARFRRTRPGRWVATQLALAGVKRAPLHVVLVTAASAFLVALVLDKLLAPAFGVLGLALTVQGLRVFLRRARERRREAFILQMPELARVLANATGAGLSIRTAISLASDELAEPASEELSRVARAMQFGDSLENGLTGIHDRLPSREIQVLVSTLLVSSRSGGSLVSSLRDIADTLEARKETRREIRTTLAQATLTGYMVAAMGLLMLVMLNTINAGTVEKMTTSTFGQVALIVSGGLYALGLFLIRRITRIEP